MWTEALRGTQTSRWASAAHDHSCCALADGPYLSDSHIPRNFERTVMPGLHGAVLAFGDREEHVLRRSEPAQCTCAAVSVPWAESCAWRP
jgi:hypothetical protein